VRNRINELSGAVAVNAPPQKAQAPAPSAKRPPTVVVEYVKYNGNDRPELSRLVAGSLSSLAGIRIEHRRAGQAYDYVVAGTVDAWTVQNISRSQSSPAADQGSQVMTGVANSVLQKLGLPAMPPQPAPSAATSVQVVQRVFIAGITLIATDHAHKVIDREHGDARITLPASADSGEGYEQAAQAAANDAAMKLTQALARIVPSTAAR